MGNFDLFRLNCFLQDFKATNFNSIIISLVNEQIFLNDNNYVSKKDCYNYIANTLNIPIEHDFFDSLIDKAKSLEITKSEDDLLLKLKPEKFTAITNNLKVHSIETHIKKFLLTKNSNPEFLPKILSILQEALYENINSFSIDNIKSLLSEKIVGRYTKSEIDIFNEFLEHNDIDKNNALYNVFLKAIEFALITSGAGVRSITKAIFKNKRYLLDSNIMFRLLGIGGYERQESLNNLLSICGKQGIKFEFSRATHLEIQRKIEASVREISNNVKEGSINILQDLVDSSPSSFNDSFFVHFCRMMKEKRVRSVERYQIQINADLRSIIKLFDLKMVDAAASSNDFQINKFAQELKNSKEKISPGIRYKKAAAKVDATNVLFVRYSRGNNNYNYSDVKSFYLTTDRTLNRILSSNRDSITETILPSQLFILHNSLYQDNSKIDFNTFIKFLKRRTTEYNLVGREVLQYIEEIRSYTTDKEQIEEIIKAYSDERFKYTLKELSSELKHSTIKEYASTYLDKKLLKAQKGDESFQAIKTKGQEDVEGIFNSSKSIMKTFDFLTYIVVIPLLSFTASLFFTSILALFISLIFIEALKFTYALKTNHHRNWWKSLFMKILYKSAYYKIIVDKDEYIEFCSEYFQNNAKSIWSKNG